MIQNALQKGLMLENAGSLWKRDSFSCILFALQTSMLEKGMEIFEEALVETKKQME